MFSVMGGDTLLHEFAEHVERMGFATVVLPAFVLIPLMT